MKNYDEIHRLEERALKEALESEYGQVIYQAAQNRMVEISAMVHANAEWVKGMGMLLDFLRHAKEKNFR